MMHSGPEKAFIFISHDCEELNTSFACQLLQKSKSTGLTAVWKDRARLDWNWNLKWAKRMLIKCEELYTNLNSLSKGKNKVSRPGHTCQLGMSNSQEVQTNVQINSFK